MHVHVVVLDRDGQRDDWPTPARVFYYLPEEIEDNLAELYKENPFLHDMGNEDYKNRSKKDRVLNEKSTSYA